MIFLASLICLLQDPSLDEMVHRVSAKEIEQTVRDLVGFHNRNTNGESPSGEHGVGAARRYLKSKLEGYAQASQGRMQVSEDWFQAEGARIKKPLQVANVVATIRGKSDPDRLYIAGGHYDSINSDRFDIEGFAPGADDDASGIAAIVEAARVLSQRDFSATIVLVAYVGEEQGLLGSKHHAAALKVAGAFVDGMITNDIVGASVGYGSVADNRGLRIFSASVSGNDSPSRQFARAAREAAGSFVSELDPQLIFRVDRFGRGGDHISFEEAGFPAIRFTEPNEDYRHQHQNVREEKDEVFGDRIEFVDFAFVAKVARLNVATLGSLALAPRAPENVKVQGALSYETKLSWDPSTDPALEGYEIVWRKTTEPAWSGSKKLGKETNVALPIILDNHVVGVRAFAKDGSRSRVSVPKGM